MALYDATDTGKTTPLDKASAGKLQEHGHPIVDENGEPVLLYIVTVAENAGKAVEEDAEQAGGFVVKEVDKAKNKLKGKDKKEEAKTSEAKTSEPSNDPDKIAENETPDADTADVAPTEEEGDPSPSNEDAVVEGDKDALDRKEDGPANANDPGYAPTGL